MDFKNKKNSSSQGPGVAPVTESFAGRISRKLQEKREAENKEDKERSARYQRVLQGLAVVRKSFQEISAIVLDERFSLNLEVEDLNGWPKLCVYLSDRLEPNWRTVGLEAHAHDRHKTGLIEIRDLRLKPLMSVEMIETGALDRLPNQLKKIVRAFLDLVEEEILNPRKPEDLLEAQTKNLLSSEPAESPVRSGPAINVNVFNEESLLGSSKNQAQEDELIPLSVDVFSGSDSE